MKTSWCRKKRVVHLMLAMTGLLFVSIAANAQSISTQFDFMKSIDSPEDQNQIECIYFARANGDDRWQLNFNRYPGGLTIADGRLFLSGGSNRKPNTGKLLELDLSRVSPIDLDSIPNSVWKKHWRKPPLSDLPVAKVIAEGGKIRAVSGDTVYFSVDPWKTEKNKTKSSLAKGLYKICKDQVSRIETREMNWGGQWYVGEQGRIWIGLGLNIAKEINPTNDVLSKMRQTIAGMEPLEMVEFNHPLAPSGGGNINVWQNSGIHAHQGLFPDIIRDSQAGLLKLYSIESDSWKATKVYEEPLGRDPIRSSYRWFKGSVFFLKNCGLDGNNRPAREGSRRLIREVNVESGEIVREIRPPDGFWYTETMCFAPDGTLIVQAVAKNWAEQRDQLYGNWRIGPGESTNFLLQIDPGSQRAKILQLMPFGLSPHVLCADQQYVYFAGRVPDRLLEQKLRDKSGNWAIYRLRIAR